MLSILIPTYNYDCTSLVLTLFNQAKTLKREMGKDFDFEIIVADDASPIVKYKNCYAKLSEFEECRFIALEHNMGRAKIRNYLESQSKFEHIVFIDCDAEVCTDNFIRLYWEKRNDADVVCGALHNPPACPDGCALRYTYEKAAEPQRSLDFRNQRPYSYFTTFNVMFQRRVFKQLQFDERCTEYGYEDALMGIMLKEKGFRVIHIDNPLIHNGIDPSNIYLSKIETSLRVLSRLGEPLQSASALVIMERRVKRYGLLPALSFVYRSLRSCLRSNLLGKRPSMLVLKFYKLGYYAQLDRKSGNV